MQQNIIIIIVIISIIILFSILGLIFYLKSKNDSPSSPSCPSCPSCPSSPSCPEICPKDGSCPSNSCSTSKLSNSKMYKMIIYYNNRFFTIYDGTDLVILKNTDDVFTPVYIIDNQYLSKTSDGKNRLYIDNQGNYKFDNDSTNNYTRFSLDNNTPNFLQQLTFIQGNDKLFTIVQETGGNWYLKAISNNVTKPVLVAFLEIA